VPRGLACCLGEELFLLTGSHALSLIVQPALFLSKLSRPLPTSELQRMKVLLLKADLRERLSTARNPGKRKRQLSKAFLRRAGLPQMRCLYLKKHQPALITI
jgi:hypothetical protein